MFKVIRETCISGATIDVTIKGSNHVAGSCRATRKNITPESVRKNNDRIAEKSLTRLLNNNFYPGDYHVVLTYAGNVPDPKKAKREFKNFIRRMAREYKKQGKEFKYISVTEFKNKRIHHHIVLNYIDTKIIQSQWINGCIRFRPLSRSRNYRKLANYLIKETSKTFRDAENVFKKRFTASRNLERPIIMREEISAALLYSDPKPLKGYAIDADSVRKFENPITGLEHVEYLMVSTDTVPRLKKWRNGKAVKKSESLKRFEDYRQESFINITGWDYV